MYNKLFYSILFIILIACACGGHKNEFYTVSQSHYARGMQRMKNKDYLNAEKEFHFELRENPRHLLALYALGDIYIIWNRLNEAERFFYKAERIDPNNSRALIGLAKIQFKKNNFENSQKLLDNVLQITECEPEAYYLLGKIQLKQNDSENAIKNFKKVLDLNSQFADTHILLKKAQERNRFPDLGICDLARRGQVTRAEIAFILGKKLTIQPGKDKPVIFAKDIRKHWAKQEISEVLELNIMELQSQRFYPDKHITKGELAIIGERLLALKLNNPSLKTAFINTVSPFPDITIDLPFYNAILLVTSYGLVDAEKNGNFQSNKIVCGSEVIDFFDKAEQLFVF